MKNKFKNQIKVMATATSLCMIMATSTTAYAKDMFSFKDVQLSKNATQASLYDHGMISISEVGLTNSNEGKALEEWHCFLEDYDKDEKLLRGKRVKLDPQYDDYGVYTKEMADKLDSIVKKYNLKLQGKPDANATVKDVIQKAGSGNFLGANTSSDPSLYEDGSFKLTGLSSPESGLKIGFLLTNFKKGTFNDAYNYFKKINDCKEWDYTTTCGIKVHLAMSPDESFVFADLGDSFMQISANTKGKHTKGQITSSSLETFANSFDFSLIKSQAASSLGNKTGKMKSTTR